ncbi:hypothetical protein ACFQI7_15650 [Paenibacillus allorhizosphaerae]|nr:hypothetical protein [Paenibacillus allorhizosphaerae]
MAKLAIEGGKPARSKLLPPNGFIYDLDAGAWFKIPISHTA